MTAFNFEDPYTYNHQYTVVNGLKYHYVDQGPKDAPLAVFLHGFPCNWFTFKYQINVFLDEGYRVVAPSMLGYGDTDAPETDPSKFDTNGGNLDAYSLKNQCQNIASLVKDHLKRDKAVFIGHGWGLAFMWRMGVYFPELCTALIVIGGYYMTRMDTFVEYKDFIKQLPIMTYQNVMADPSIIEAGNENIETFVHMFYNSEAVKNIMNPELPKLLKEKAIEIDSQYTFLPPKDLQYYTEEIKKKGVHAITNYYRTRYINYLNELKLTDEQLTIRVPTLAIMADKDVISETAMQVGKQRMYDYCKQLTFKHIPEGKHFFLIQESAPEINGYLKEFLHQHNLSANGVQQKTYNNSFELFQFLNTLNRYDSDYI